MVIEKSEYVNFLIVGDKYVKLKNMIHDIDAYILAGGESRRMGKNKAALEWKGMNLIEHVYDSAKQIFESVYVVTKKNSEIVSLNLPFVFDAQGCYCPMMGLYAALLHTKKPFIFVKACDNVCFEKGLVLRMLSLRGQADIIVPETSDGFHPLFAVYSKTCLPFIEDMIRRENYKVTGFFDKANVYYMKEEEIKRYDSGMVSLMNINTPEDFEGLKRTCL